MVATKNALEVAMVASANYFSNLMEKPDTQHLMYKEESSLTFGTGEDTTKVRGKDAIKSTLLGGVADSFFKPDSVQLSCIDGDEISDGLVLVTIEGRLGYNNFTQAMVISPQESPVDGYYIVNNVVKFVGSAAGPNTGVQTPIPQWTPGAQPKEEPVPQPVVTTRRSWSDESEEAKDEEEELLAMPTWQVQAAPKEPEAPNEPDVVQEYAPEPAWQAQEAPKEPEAVNEPGEAEESEIPYAPTTQDEEAPVVAPVPEQQQDVGQPDVASVPEDIPEMAQYIEPPQPKTWASMVNSSPKDGTGSKWAVSKARGFAYQAWPQGGQGAFSSAGEGDFPSLNEVDPKAGKGKKSRGYGGAKGRGH